MHRIQTLYQKTVVPALQEKFGYTNMLATPRITKVVVNVGVGKGLKDPKFNEVVESTLVRISGQVPVKIKARKSISNFKIRAGQVVGMAVTLRGARMYDFIDKLVNVAFPRIRDFRGLELKGIDRAGNFSVGFKEHIAFPEIKSDEVDQLHGLQVVITTTAKTQDEGLALLRLLGFPFRS